ncbi:hypothetical protein TS65_19875 [Aneurinibacillus migulanus]|uniref:Uncharacterized protein n=1 Tax=Aneurinibacillus migulanus TaxID=47500 RepID=A0A0D1Y3M4_ANEMI|nr:hypothetical protein TS65_19875 [Aneurinibacillus migulanus]KON96076.1 hypothetical protein AF333_11850 [Aneurinibacillus migulanus]GED14703.1 hypothetical protein AMI01nite_26940 [Aneurinibacillus migulanus]SDJ70988.1 hypothetical protein SAMN04487909_12619 [Aneurinibacillus migulanus]
MDQKVDIAVKEGSAIHFLSLVSFEKFPRRVLNVVFSPCGATTLASFLFFFLNFLASPLKNNNLHEYM